MNEFSLESLDAVVNFNFNLASYIDESWLSSIPYGCFIRKYRNESSALPYLSRYLVEYFDLNGEYYFDVNEFSKCFSFMRSEDLVKTIKMVGVVLNSAAIRKLVLKEDVANLRNAIGDEVYNYAVNSASLFERFQVVENKRRVSCSIEKKIILSGASIFMSLVDEQPMAVRKRLKLKIPYQWSNFSQRHIVSFDGNVSGLLYSIRNDVVRN